MDLLESVLAPGNSVLFIPVDVLDSCLYCWSQTAGGTQTITNVISLFSSSQTPHPIQRLELSGEDSRSSLAFICWSRSRIPRGYTETAPMAWSSLPRISCLVNGRGRIFSDTKCHESCLARSFESPQHPSPAHPSLFPQMSKSPAWKDALKKTDIPGDRESTLNPQLQEWLTGSHNLRHSLLLHIQTCAHMCVHTHSCTHTVSLLPLDGLACCMCTPFPQTSPNPFCPWKD